MKQAYLDHLLPAAAILSGDMPQAVPVSSVVYDSRKVQPGSLFVAINGFMIDGHKFLEEAAAKGAVAAVVEKADPAAQIPQFRVADSRLALAHLSARFYAPEIHELTKVGITGTNGKTTISYLVKSVLASAGMSCGLIGTIRYEVGSENRPAWNTTPESTDLCEMLYRMYQHGQNACVMEVSSHALALHRVAGLRFCTAVFTNLTQDHLDFHQDLDDYFTAKRRLFDYLADNGTAVVNTDDPYGQQLSRQLTCAQITYGFNKEAGVRLLSHQSTINGIHLTAQTPAGEITLDSPLLGKFNIENILAALAVGCSLKINKENLMAGIEQTARVPGRLEPIDISGGRLAVVDYAHTPDALEKALAVLKELVPGRLWVVFGCGGNRDKKKRPLMGAIAQKIADKIVVTSDNPRFEEPQEIIAQILDGMQPSDDLYVNADRRQAISYALQQAQEDDIVLVAGKGHEDYQEIKGIKYPFDDRKIILELVS